MSISPVASAQVQEAAHAAEKKATTPPPAQAATPNNIGPAVNVTLSKAAAGDTDHDGDSK